MSPGFALPPNMRVLSHRVRGFGPAEGSISNIRAAIDSGARLIEIDTRHTRDSKIVVHHPPCLGTLTTGQGSIRDLPLAAILKERFLKKRDEGIARLEEVLSLVATKPDVEVWVDVKDFGLEEQYIDLVRRACIHERVRVISWVPQTVLRLYQLDPQVKIGFSYSCTAAWGWVHRLLRRLAIGTGIQGKPLSVRHRPGRWADSFATIPLFHPLAQDFSDESPPPYGVGYNHAHLIPGLPQGRLLESLVSGGGAIGMLPNQATPDVVREAHRLGLIVYVYSLDCWRKLVPFAARSPVDVVFSNNAELVRQAAASA